MKKLSFSKMKFLIVFVTFIFSFLNLSFGQIITLEDLSELTKKIESLKEKYKPEDILVIFSVENTLIKPKDARILIKDQGEVEPTQVMKKSFQNLNLNKADYIQDVLFINFEHELVDKDIIEVINGIKESSIPIIAMSEGMIGKLNEIPRLEVNKADKLNKLGIDLSKIFSKDDFYISNSAKKPKNQPELAVFYNGVITYDSSISISKAFIDFIFQIKYTPAVIVVIDYNKSNLDSFLGPLRSFNNNIEFLGYHYNVLDKIESDPFGDNQATIDFWQKFVKKVNNAKR